MSEAARAIYVTTVTDLDDDDDQQVIADLVDDPVDALTQAVAIEAGRLLATMRSRVVGKG